MYIVTLKRETVLVVLMGIFPALLSYKYGSIIGLKNFIEASSVPEAIFWYFFIAFAIHIILAGYGVYYAWNLSDEGKRNLKSIRGITSDVSSGLVGIYRVVSGLLLCIPIIWKYVEPNTLSTFQFAMLELIGVSFFIGSCIISGIAAWATNASNK